MEEFTEKKLQAGKRLATLQKEREETILKHTQQTQNLTRAKGNEDNNYQQDHENWKAKMALDIASTKREYEAEIELLEAEIADRDLTYVQTHKESIQVIDQKLDALERDHAKYLKLREMDEKAIKAEIKEIDSAVKSLQDMSKEQAA